MPSVRVEFDDNSEVIVEGGQLQIDTSHQSFFSFERELTWDINVSPPSLLIPPHGFLSFACVHSCVVSNEDI